MTVIAGYHWFGDWGRDTMIALPGLALATGRPELAARVLRTFARFVDRGMLPNRFPDAGETPEYNTVDATLWFVEAVRATHAATGDDATAEGRCSPALESVIDWHRRGTRYGIRVDPADGLLRAGRAGRAAHLDGRQGRRLGRHAAHRQAGRDQRALVQRAACDGRLRPARSATGRAVGRRRRAGAPSFDALLVRGGAAICYDVRRRPGRRRRRAAAQPDLRRRRCPRARWRPSAQRRVVDACARHLLTPYGLRTLAPGRPGVLARRYAGDPRARDGAYHQGTVWGWLLGPFALAHAARPRRSRGGARRCSSRCAHHLDDYGVGSIAEIFDGDAPFVPRGCIAQAWSVAETLRAWHALSGGPPPRGPRRRSSRPS